MKTRTVELRTAYHWFCEDCSRENFSLPEKPELTKTERAQVYRGLNGIAEWESLPEGWEQFEVVTIPEIVVCQHCKGEFETIDERAVGDDEVFDPDRV